MRQVEQIMGMPVSIDIPDAKNSVPFRRAFGRLKEIDSRFSTYKPESEVARFSNGEIKRQELSKELEYVIKQCEDWQAKTGGFFSAWAGGAFEPSGYVKGWAISEAGKEIEKHGFEAFCIGAGGDILARSAGAKPWRIGIHDPTDHRKILNKLSILNGAVATSGNYHRGPHIINPKNKKPAGYFKSVSVTGPDIVAADVLATAVFAAGPRAGRAILKKFPDYEALLLI